VAPADGRAGAVTVYLTCLARFPTRVAGAPTSAASRAKRGSWPAPHGQPRLSRPRVGRSQPHHLRAPRDVAETAGYAPAARNRANGHDGGCDARLQWPPRTTTQPDRQSKGVPAVPHLLPHRLAELVDASIGVALWSQASGAGPAGVTDGRHRRSGSCSRAYTEACLAPGIAPSPLSSSASSDMRGCLPLWKFRP
jgi:hypothetical protein